MDSITTQTIDCAVQHIKNLYKQSIEERKADFAEPCASCEYVAQCHCDWLGQLSPLLERSNVTIPLNRSAYQCKEDISE